MMARQQNLNSFRSMHSSQTKYQLETTVPSCFSLLLDIKQIRNSKESGRGS